MARRHTPEDVHRVVRTMPPWTPQEIDWVATWARPGSAERRRRINEEGTK